MNGNIVDSITFHVYNMIEDGEREVIAMATSILVAGAVKEYGSMLALTLSKKSVPRDGVRSGTSLQGVRGDKGN